MSSIYHPTGNELSVTPEQVARSPVLSRCHQQGCHEPVTLIGYIEKTGSVTGGCPKHIYKLVCFCMNIAGQFDDLEHNWFGVIIVPKATE